MMSISQKALGKQAANLSTMSLSVFGKLMYNLILMHTGLLTVEVD